MPQFITDEHKESSLLDLKTLLSIPSVLNEEEASEGAPLGPAIRDALVLCLDICKRLGMRTYMDPEGYYAYAEVGEGEELLGIVTHLDVVPAGDLKKWNTDPFHPIEIDGKIYARGSQDDKGPTIVSIYALKSIMDAGYEFNSRVRIFFGSDEETFWRGIDRYNEVEEPFTQAIIPDGTFPLIYAEKGLWQARLMSSGTQTFKLYGGEAANVVPGKAVYEGDLAHDIAVFLDETEVNYKHEKNYLEVYGKSVHASTPELGTNAIMTLVKAVSKVHDHPLLKSLTEQIGSELNGERIFGDVSDDLSGSLSLNVGQISIEGAESVAVIDIRYPVSNKIEDLEEKMQAAFSEYELEYLRDDALSPLYVDPESDLIQKLMKVYREYTGDMTEPMVVGGATYARKVPYGVTFGPLFAEAESLAHQENEYYEIEHMYQAMDIYANAIVELACNI